MTDLFAIEYAKYRMREMGFHEFHLRFREVKVKANSSVTLELPNQLLLLISPDGNIVVKSSRGEYDDNSLTLNENMYEHQGFVKITNISANQNRVKFLQVVPLQNN